MPRAVEFVNDLEENACNEEHSLAILKMVQKAYEHKLESISYLKDPRKTLMQVDVLKAWVKDLIEQNTLLSIAVEELESEASNKVLIGQQRHVESDKRRCKCDKLAEIKLAKENSQNENMSKEKEIRKLHKDVQQYEKTIRCLRNELSSIRCSCPEELKKGIEVMAGMCGTGKECGDMEPEKEFKDSLLEDTLKFQEYIRSMEGNLIASNKNVITLREINVNLEERVSELQTMCIALTEKSEFKNEIIREMIRQLRKAKDKLKAVPLEFNKESDSCKNGSTGKQIVLYDKVTISCVCQPRSVKKPISLENLSCQNNDNDSASLGNWRSADENKEHIVKLSHSHNHN